MAEEVMLAMIDREIEWWEAQGQQMRTREAMLALAVVIGATKALREIRGKVLPTLNGVHHD